MEKKKDAEDIREWFMRLPVVVHIFLAAIALWLLSLMVLKSLDVYTRHNESIVVPNVKGKTPEEAHREIRKIGLRYIVLDSIYSKDMAPGAIVEVVPAIGSKVKKDRILYLTINARTAQMAIVPDVTDPLRSEYLGAERCLLLRTIHLCGGEYQQDGAGQAPVLP